MFHTSKQSLKSGSKRGSTTKLLVSVGVLGVAGAVVGLASIAAHSSIAPSDPVVDSELSSPGRPSRRHKRSKSRKILLSFSALGVAGAMAGLGTFAAYTSTTSSSATVSTGIVHISLPTDGTAGNRISIAATGVLPGDTVARAVDLSSTSTDALASVKLTTTAPTTSSALNTDATNGLQLVVQKCSATWTETANTAPQSGYSYTCSGSTTSVLTTAAVIQAASTLNNLTATTTPGNITATTDHLLVTMTLPSGTTEGTVAQGASSVIVFSFTAAQHTPPASR